MGGSYSAIEDGGVDKKIVSIDTGMTEIAVPQTWQILNTTTSVKDMVQWKTV